MNDIAMPLRRCGQSMRYRQNLPETKTLDPLCNSISVNALAAGDVDVEKTKAESLTML